jgi:hypothetical protein
MQKKLKGMLFRFGVKELQVCVINKVYNLLIEVKGA